MVHLIDHRWLTDLSVIVIWTEHLRHNPWDWSVTLMFCILWSLVPTERFGSIIKQATTLFTCESRLFLITPTTTDSCIAITACRDSIFSLCFYGVFFEGEPRGRSCAVQVWCRPSWRRLCRSPRTRVPRDTGWSRLIWCARPYPVVVSALAYPAFCAIFIPKNQNLNKKCLHNNQANFNYRK